ncbi:hypothetical protein DL95DRAFT_504496 [Leptodontidium sp. 2 PMI_412]|nr:hypothetical protein DL95DRAFT_504496 [Leptodontidium sp. 2 PMI_412]
MTSTEKSPGVDVTGAKDMGKRRNILFFTSSEYGQANVILAVAYELLALQQYEVHIASFEPLRQRVDGLNKLFPQDGIAVIFHSIVGQAALNALVAKDEFIGPYSPGVRGALNTYRVTLPAMADTWTEAEYMSSYQSCLDIVSSVEPNIIIADPLMSQGLEACNTLSRKHVILTSGFSYPVPLHLIPANIYLKVALIWILVTSPKVRALIRYRNSNKLPSLPPVFNIWQENNHCLLPSVPETDYPCHIPPNVTPCGPILLPVTPVSRQDPDLFTWLKRGPTILINLGSHIRMDDTMAREFSSGLKIFLDKSPILGSIAAERSSGRIRIAEWLSVDPLAILETGLIACSVHHGGSNSFHEALSAGVPQVILPCWLDTLDFANKVEWLGIGVYGSKMTAPSVEAWELSRAFLKVVDDSEEASQMALKARELADISGKVGGRKKACNKIVELLESSW